MKHVWRLLPAMLRIAIGVGLLGYLGTSGAIDWTVLGRLALAWPMALEGVLLLGVTVVLASWRLCLLCRPHQLHLSLWASIKLSLIGTFFNTCLPGATGGDIVRIYYATAGNSGRRMEVATILLFDRLVGMFALVLWPLLVAPLFAGLLAALPRLSLLLWGAAALITAMSLGMLVCLVPQFQHSRLFTWCLQRMPLGNLAERMLTTVSTYRHNAGLLVAAVVLSLLVHGLITWTLLRLVSVTNPHGVAWSMLLLIPLGFLANTLPLTPGGLGVGEAALNRLFAMAGFTGGAEALLGWRMLMFLLGLLGLIVYLGGSRRFVQAQQACSPSTTSHDASTSSAPASLSW